MATAHSSGAPHARIHSNILGSTAITCRQQSQYSINVFSYLKTVKPLLSPFLKPVTYMINELSLSRNHTILTIVTITTNNGNYVTKLATQANAKRLTQLYRRSASRAKPTRPCTNLSLTQRLRLHHLHTLNIPYVEPTRRPCSDPNRRPTAEHSSRRQSQAYRYPQPNSQHTYQASLIVHQSYA